MPMSIATVQLAVGSLFVGFVAFVVAAAVAQPIRFSWNATGVRSGICGATGCSFGVGRLLAAAVGCCDVHRSWGGEPADVGDSGVIASGQAGDAMGQLSREGGGRVTGKDPAHPETGGGFPFQLVLADQAGRVGQADRFGQVA